MKKLLLFILMLCTLPLMAQRIPARVQELVQNGTTYRPISPLTAVNTSNTATDTIVRNATYAKFNRELVKGIFQNKYAYIELSIPYNSTVITMQLYRTELTAEGFHIDTDKRQNIVYTPGAYYRGIIKGNPNSVAAFSFFENQMYGIVSAHGINNVVVGRIDVPGNVTDYIVYSDSNLITPHTFKCATTDKETPHNTSQKTILGTQSEHCVTLYFELRHNAYEANGNSVTQTVNWFTALFNNVQTLFENDGITTAVKSVYVWETPDPYDMGTPSAYDLLDQFAAQTPVFDADAGQLINYGGGNGLAYDIGALCSDRNRSYAKVNPFYQPLPAYSPAVKMIAHELGHTLGSQHTHGCYWNGNNTAIDGCFTGEGNCPPGPVPSAEEGGTIMSYCGTINFANGLGPQPTQRILQHIAASACLGTNCINSCTNSISTLNLIDTSPSTATLSWNDAEGSTWQIGYAAYNQEITNWQEVTQNTFVIEGLDANTYYTFSVQNVCSAGVTAGSKTLSFSTGADWCGGAVWTDTGGANGNYTETQHTVTIIKPPVAGQAVTVTFQDFWTQLQDVVYVYNGIGTTAPLLGSWTGYSPPVEPYVANNPTGALTFEFITDMGVYPSEGWEATVTCSTMGIDDAAFASLHYYPNPVTETLTITTPSGFSNIAVYNIAGQLLTQKQVETTSYNIDMQGYAPGVYIVKISNGTAATHIRVIKQ